MRSIFLSITLLCFCPTALFPEAEAIGTEANYTIISSMIVSSKNGTSLSTQTSIKLSSAMEKALNHGVPLTFAFSGELTQIKSWLPDPVVLSFYLDREIRYHALSQRYILVNLNNNSQQTFSSLRVLINQLGSFNSATIGPSLNAGLSFMARLEVHLDISALPPALRIPATLSSQWHLKGRPREWQVL